MDGTSASGTSCGRRGSTQRRPATARRRAPRAANARSARSSTPRWKSSARRASREGSIVGITSRARVALGTFYTYFDSKEAVFQELVRDMSAQVRDHVAPVLTEATDTLDGESRALESFLAFVQTHRQVYRIIDEAEFVDPEGFRKHYVTTAERIGGAPAGGQGQGRGRSDGQPARDRSRGLGDHGDERFPRAALRGLGQGLARRSRPRSPTVFSSAGSSPSEDRRASRAKRVDVALVMIEREADPQDVAAHIGDAVARPSARSTIAAHSRCGTRGSGRRPVD